MTDPLTPSVAVSAISAAKTGKESVSSSVSVSENGSDPSKLPAVVEEEADKDDPLEQMATAHDDARSGSRSGEEEWTELMGKDVVMKIIAGTTSNAAPVHPKDAVVVDFVGRLAVDRNEDNGPVFHRATGWLVVVAEKDVVPALELAIRFMHAGETAVVWSHSKFAYGQLKRKSNDISIGDNLDGRGKVYELPPHSNVRYEVTVKSVVPDFDREDPSFQIRASRAKKIIGNDVYANEWSDGQGKLRSIQLYKRGADGIEHLVTSDPIEHEPEKTDSSHSICICNQAKSVLLDCLNNIVAVHMRAKEYHQAKEAAVAVLSHDPTNRKALVRAAKACLLDPASLYEEVQAAIDAAKAQTSAAAADDDGYVAELQRLQTELKRRRTEYKKKSKEMFTRMMAADDAKQPASSVSENARYNESSGIGEEEKDAAAPKAATGPDAEAASDADVGEASDRKTEIFFDWKSYLYQLVLQLIMVLVIGGITRYYNRVQEDQATAPSNSAAATEL